MTRSELEVKLNLPLFLILKTKKVEKLIAE
jgi:hypothetical protein